MSTSMESAYATQANVVLDRLATEELIRSRLAREAADAQAAGNVAMVGQADIVPTQPQ